MKLYLVFWNGRYSQHLDTYDSMVVCAKSPTDAVSIDPQGGKPIDWAGHHPHWAQLPGDLTVKCIVTASPGVARGLVLASFNAG